MGKIYNILSRDVILLYSSEVDLSAKSICK